MEVSMSVFLSYRFGEHTKEFAFVRLGYADHEAGRDRGGGGGGDEVWCSVCGEAESLTS